MKRGRIPAVVLIVLIAVDFVYMVIQLFHGSLDTFLIGGGVLVALLAAGYLLKKVYSPQKDAEEKQE